ncbi:unnamed protein product [Arabidopsis halleri]
MECRDSMIGTTLETAHLTSDLRIPVASDTLNHR